MVKFHFKTMGTKAGIVTDLQTIPPVTPTTPANTTLAKSIHSKSLKYRVRDSSIRAKTYYATLPAYVRLGVAPLILAILTLVNTVVSRNNPYLLYPSLFLGVMLLSAEKLFLYMEQTNNIFSQYIRSVSLSSFQYIDSINDTKTNMVFRLLEQNEHDLKAQIRLARDKMHFDEIAKTINAALFEVIKTYVRSRRKTQSADIVMVLIKPDKTGHAELIGDILKTKGADSLPVRLQKLRLLSGNTFASILWRNQGAVIKSTSDTEKSKENGEFVWLDDNEPHFLKSLLCYRIDDPKGRPMMMWCIDANMVGAFPDDTFGKGKVNSEEAMEFDIINGVLTSFAKKLRYEKYFTDIMEKSRKVFNDSQGEVQRLTERLASVEKSKKG